MKNWLTVLPWIICLLMLAYIGQCTYRGEVNQIVNHIDTTVYSFETQTIEIKGDTVYSPTPYQVVDTFKVSQNVDTSAILADYNKLNKYDLSVSNDTNSKINVFAEVQFNKIISWHPEATYYPHTTIIDNTRTITIPKRNKLLAGLILTGNKEYFGASPSVMFISKKDNAFQVGYDVINKNYQVGYFVKIGKR